MQTLTGGMSENFLGTKQRENNCGQIISANCNQRQKLFTVKSQYTAVG
jgi:hypothetical protein